MFVVMVKLQSSCFQSVAAQPKSSLGEADAMEPVSLIPAGEHMGAFSQARLWGAALGRNVSPLATTWLMAIATATAISTATPALSAGIGDWSYSPETGAIGFALDSAAQPKYFLMANPMRIVVDLPGASANLQALEAQSGGVFSNIRASQTPEGQTRLVLQLSPGTVLQPGQVELTAMGGGRWSLQPLLADEWVNEFQPEPEFMAEGAPVATVVSGVDELVEADPEFSLPSLEAMEAAAGAEEEFVSMEETLERQFSQGEAPAPVAVPQRVVPVADSSVEWGSSQLPPVPTNIAIAPAMAQPAAAGIASIPQTQFTAEPAFLPQLPQPRLGEAPLAFNPPMSASLVDPAQIVDTRQLRQANAAFSPRPPAAVEPVIDPKLLSLDEQQSAAVLGGQTGLVFRRGFAPAARQSVAPEQSVILPVVAPEPEVAQPEAGGESIPFLVEFGAPLPGVGL